MAERTWSFVFSFKSSESINFRVIVIVTTPCGLIVPMSGFAEQKPSCDVVLTWKHTFFFGVLVSLITAETGSLKGPVMRLKKSKIFKLSVYIQSAYP